MSRYWSQKELVEMDTYEYKVLGWPEYATTNSTSNVVVYSNSTNLSMLAQPATPKKPAKETPEEWLRRRVEEVMWQPT